MTYQEAVGTELSAPRPHFAPFTATVEESAYATFRALIVSTQGDILSEGCAWWPDRRLAQIEADAMRIHIIAEFARRQR